MLTLVLRIVSEDDDDDDDEEEEETEEKRRSDKSDEVALRDDDEVDALIVLNPSLFLTLSGKYETCMRAYPFVLLFPAEVCAFKTSYDVMRCVKNRFRERERESRVTLRGSRLRAILREEVFAKKKERNEIHIFYS
jgi:hypothetical protein